MRDELCNEMANISNDFFELLLQGQKFKFSMIKKHPALSIFLINSYLEDDKNVQATVQQYYTELFETSSASFLTYVDTNKFKDDVNPQVVYNLIKWSAEGFFRTYGVEEIAANFDEIGEEYMDVMQLMKRNFYKEEYL